MMIEEIASKAKETAPFAPLSLLRKVEELDWIITKDDSCEIYCEIVLALNSSIITSAHDKDKLNSSKYREIFERIKKSIELSSICTMCPEFAEYFAKYKEYMKDFGS